MAEEQEPQPVESDGGIEFELDDSDLEASGVDPPLAPVPEPKSAYDIVAFEAETEAGMEPMVLDTTARSEKLKPRISVKQAIERYGKDNASKTIIAQERTKAWLANRELIRRLMSDPAGFKTAELNYTSGTAVDKIAKKERWDKAGDDGGASWAELFVGTIAKLQAGGGLKLSLEVVPRGTKAVEANVLPAIDVESVPEAMDGSLPELR